MLKKLGEERRQMGTRVRHLVRSSILLGAMFIAGSIFGGQAIAEEISVQAYAASRTDCLAWSDKCVTCARDEQGATHCSTPGIACLPAAIVCKVSKASPSPHEPLGTDRATTGTPPVQTKPSKEE